MTTDAATARRQQIVVSAYRVFTEQGYQPSSVADIAADTGVSHGTFYNYFSNKRDVVDAVIDYAVAAVFEIIARTPEDPIESLDDLVTFYRTMMGDIVALVAREDRLISMLVFEAGAVDDALTQKVLNLYCELGAAVATSLQGGVDRGFVNPDLDVTVLGESLTALALGLVLPRQSGAAPILTDTGHIIDQIANLLRSGLAPTDTQ